jgi:hypothetical protein
VLHKYLSKNVRTSIFLWWKMEMAKYEVNKKSGTKIFDGC